MIFRRVCFSISVFGSLPGHSRPLRSRTISALPSRSDILHTDPHCDKSSAAFVVPGVNTCRFRRTSQATIRYLVGATPERLTDLLVRAFLAPSRTTLKPPSRRLSAVDRTTGSVISTAACDPYATSARIRVAVTKQISDQNDLLSR